MTSLSPKVKKVVGCMNNSPHAKRSRARARGFTLIELLVVFVMLSFIMIGLGQALQSMGKIEEKVDDRLARADQMRTVKQFLLGTLSRVDATKVRNPARSAEAGVLFRADQLVLEWVGVMPARPGVGGRYFMRLSMETVQGGMNGLVFRYQPWTPSTNLPDFSEAPSQVLVSPIKSLSIQVKGIPREFSSVRTGWPQGWQMGWPIVTEIPQQVSLAIEDTKGVWPLLTIPMTPTVSSTPEESGFVAGGKR